MSDLAPSVQNRVFGIFSSRQDAIAGALAQVASAATGSNATSSPGASTAQSRGAYPHSFTLTLTDSAQSSQSTTSSTPVTKGSPPAIAKVTFDVLPSAQTNGHAQRVSYTQRARQSIQNTLGGYHMNEYGVAPGKLDIDAKVIWSTTPNADILAFFSLLKLGKQSNPFDTNPPRVLKYFDAFLNLSLIISQEEITLDQDAESQGIGILRISSTVLYDYDSSNVPPQSTISGTPDSDPSTLASVLSGLTNLA